MQSANLTQQGYEKDCFGAGTLLLTPEGFKAIEQFGEGDLVLSRSEFDPDSAVQAKGVEKVFVRTGRVWVVKLQGRNIWTTAEHPVFLVRLWKFALVCELHPGDMLLSRCGRLIRIEEVSDTGRFETVYNLRVADFHTYFVGCQQWGFSVWSHNRYDIDDHGNVMGDDARNNRLRGAVTRQLKAAGYSDTEARQLAVLGAADYTDGRVLRADMGRLQATRRGTSGEDLHFVEGDIIRRMAQQDAGVRWDLARPVGAPSTYLGHGYQEHLAPLASTGEMVRLIRFHNGEYFCHGLSTRGSDVPGRYSPHENGGSGGATLGDGMAFLLNRNYQRIERATARPGDLVVFRESDGRVWYDMPHSATLTHVAHSGGELLPASTRVQTKNGLAAEANMTLSEVQQQYPYRFELWRRKSP